MTGRVDKPGQFFFKVEKKLQMKSEDRKKHSLWKTFKDCAYCGRYFNFRIFAIS